MDFRWGVLGGNRFSRFCDRVVDLHATDFSLLPITQSRKAAGSYIEALASSDGSAKMWNFPPRLLGSLVTEMKEEELEWHR